MAGDNNWYQWEAHRLLKQAADELHSPTVLFETPDRRFDPGLAAAFTIVFDGDVERAAELCELPHDPAAMHHDNQPEAVTEPVLHVPKARSISNHTDEFAVYRHRRRYAEQSGYVETGGYVPDQPTDDFMSVVGMVLQRGLEKGHVGNRQIKHIRSAAERLKRHADDLRDTHILTKVIRDVTQRSLSIPDQDPPTDGAVATAASRGV